MAYKIRFFKDRLKFSSAHFTLFPDGGCEKLHGHNYRVSVELSVEQLHRGLACPFHELKPILETAIKPLDEMVLMPSSSEWVSFSPQGEQTKVHVKTPMVNKEYSFPNGEVFLLPGENVSSEQLARFLFEELKRLFSEKGLDIQVRSLCVLESSGQEVCYTED